MATRPRTTVATDVSGPRARPRRALRHAAAIGATAVGFALYSRFTRTWLPLGWVALVPWLLVLEDVGSPRAAAASGVAMAAAFELAVFGWFAPAIESYTGAPAAVAALLLGICGPFLQPQFVAFALARDAARRAAAPGWLVAMVGAGAYAGTEWAVPKLFADTLGYGLHPSRWMRQGADVVGVEGLTFAVVLGNECALGFVHAARARGRVARLVMPAASLVAIVALLSGYGAIRLRTLAGTTSPGDALAAGIVQANLSHYDALRARLGTYETVRRIVDDYVALSGDLLQRGRLDVLVWPETVYPTTFGTPKSADGAAFDGEIAAFVTRTHLPLVFGSYDADAGHEFNAAVVLEPPGAGAAAWRRTPGADGALAYETYRKASLFPLTERVPAVLDSPRLRRWLPWAGTWTPGTGAKVIPVALADGRTVRVAPLICYDVLAPALVHAAARAGAELFVTLSNDSWFASGEGPHLHLVGAAFRSVETRRAQVRATNTGISAIITAAGDVAATAGIDERATLVGSVVPDRKTTTVVVAWGDWFAPTALAGGIVLLALARRGRR
jgi:apolipoprotein N-acyltransferase